MLKAEKKPENLSSIDKNIVEFKSHQQANQKRNFFTQIPNLIDDLPLSPNEKSLYLHLARLAGATFKPIHKPIRQLAAHCKMSLGAAQNAKTALHSKGLIELVPYSTDSGPAHEIRVIDIWQKNSEKYDTSKTNHSKSFNQKPVEQQPVHIEDLSKDQIDLKADQSDLLNQVLNLVQKLLHVHGLDLSVHEHPVSVQKPDLSVHEHPVSVQKSDLSVHEHPVSVQKSDLSVHEREKSVNALKEHVNNLNNLNTHMILPVEHELLEEQQNRDVCVYSTQGTVEEFSASNSSLQSQNVKQIEPNHRIQNHSNINQASEKLPNLHKSSIGFIQNYIPKSSTPLFAEPVHTILETPEEFFVPVDDKFQELFLAVTDMQQHCFWINWIYQKRFTVEEAIFCINTIYEEFINPKKWRDARVTMKTIADNISKTTIKIRNKKLPYSQKEKEIGSELSSEKINTKPDEKMQQDGLNAVQMEWQNEALAKELFKALSAEEQEGLIIEKFEMLELRDADFKTKFARFSDAQKRAYVISLIEQDLLSETQFSISLE